MVQDFWDKFWTDFKPFEFDPVTAREMVGPSVKMLLDLVGNVNGKNVLDIGCGNGLLSVYLAKIGGKVTAIDNSQVAVKNTIDLMKINQVDSLLEVYKLNAMELNDLNKSFDLVVGRFILHHIEPFDTFSEILNNVMTSGGRGIFLENNSRNPILMFFRTFVIGRFGIPKYGDNQEYPFEPREIEIIKQRFNSIFLHYPEFTFFSLMGTYLCRNNRKLGNIFKKMDKCIFNYLPVFHKYTYHQIIEVQKSGLSK